MSTEQAFVQFVSDDDGYLRWLRENPQGLVVNSHRVPVSNYLILDRASWLRSSTPNRTNWTTKVYIKTCSTDVTALIEWARREVGGVLKPCGTCRPVLKARPISSPTPRQPVSEKRTLADAKAQPSITPSPTPTRPLAVAVGTDSGLRQLQAGLVSRGVRQDLRQGCYPRRRRRIRLVVPRSPSRSASKVGAVQILTTNQACKA